MPYQAYWFRFRHPQVTGPHQSHHRRVASSGRCPSSAAPVDFKHRLLCHGVWNVLYIAILFKATGFGGFWGCFSDLNPYVCAATWFPELIQRLGHHRKSSDAQSWDLHRKILEWASRNGSNGKYPVPFNSILGTVRCWCWDENMSENPGENSASFMFHSPLLTPAKHRTSMDSSRAPAHLPLQRAVPHSKNNRRWKPGIVINDSTWASGKNHVG